MAGLSEVQMCDLYAVEEGNGEIPTVDRKLAEGGRR